MFFVITTNEPFFLHSSLTRPSKQRSLQDSPANQKRFNGSHIFFFFHIVDHAELSASVYLQELAKSKFDWKELFVDVRLSSLQTELITGIKAAATCVLEHNGIIKSFENLGLRRLPSRLVANDMQTYREGQ